MESDQDFKPLTATSYDDRWLLELLFNRYKGNECLDRTGVQGDFSVIEPEFANFISTVAPDYTESPVDRNPQAYVLWRADG